MRFLRQLFSSSNKRRGLDAAGFIIAAYRKSGLWDQITAKNGYIEA